MKKIKLLNLLILVSIIFFVGKVNVNADTVTSTNDNNEMEVQVPNTLNGKTALLLSFAMFDIALGIGIVTYVKKNKVTE